MWSRSQFRSLDQTSGLGLLSRPDQKCRLNFELDRGQNFSLGSSGRQDFGLGRGLEDLVSLTSLTAAAAAAVYVVDRVRVGHRHSLLRRVRPFSPDWINPSRDHDQSSLICAGVHERREAAARYCSSSQPTMTLNLHAGVKSMAYNPHIGLALTFFSSKIFCVRGQNARK